MADAIWFVSAGHLEIMVSSLVFKRRNFLVPVSHDHGIRSIQLISSSDTRSDLQEEIRFSPLLTVLCLLVCAAGMGLLFWAVTLSDDVRLASPASRDLERIASRMLGFESRLPELSSFEQVMYRLGGQDGETQEQIQLWYEETG